MEVTPEGVVRIIDKIQIKPADPWRGSTDVTEAKLNDLSLISYRDTASYLKKLMETMGVSSIDQYINRNNLIHLSKQIEDDHKLIQSRRRPFSSTLAFITRDFGSDLSDPQYVTLDNTIIKNGKVDLLQGRLIAFSNGIRARRDLVPKGIDTESRFIVPGIDKIQRQALPIEQTLRKLANLRFQVEEFIKNNIADINSTLDPSIFGPSGFDYENRMDNKKIQLRLVNRFFKNLNRQKQRLNKQLKRLEKVCGDITIKTSINMNSGKLSPSMVSRQQTKEIKFEGKMLSINLNNQAVDAQRLETADDWRFRSANQLIKEVRSSFERQLQATIPLNLSSGEEMISLATKQWRIIEKQARELGVSESSIRNARKLAGISTSSFYPTLDNLTASIDSRYIKIHSLSEKARQAKLFLSKVLTNPIDPALDGNMEFEDVMIALNFAKIALNSDIERANLVEPICDELFAGGLQKVTEVVNL